MQAFLKQNSFVNLISKNDESLLWEKHIFDSLAIDNFFKKYIIRNIYLKNGKDYISIESFKTGSVMSIPIHTTINLKGNCSGKISLPKNLL